MSATAEHLLANRELLSLDHARLYLGARCRTRTPFGAAEYLRLLKDPAALWWKPRNNNLVFERKDKPLTNDLSSAFEKRLKVALDCMEIYRNAFPREYAASPSPAFSLQREQELYYLVHTQLFPLLRNENDLHRITAEELAAFLESQPDFFLPYIPLRGGQRHLWEEGMFNFREIEIEYQVAFALTWQWQMPAGAGWELLKKTYQLDDCPVPLQSSARVAGGTIAWSLFCHTCRVSEEPLRWLPLAFQLISYKTGNYWLDLPPVGAMGLEWSLRQVFELHLMHAQAEDMKLALKALGVWLEANPREHIGRCVEVWNDAVRKELQSGMEGWLRD